MENRDMMISGIRLSHNEPIHNTQFTLDLDSLTDLEEFIAAISEIEGDVNAKYGVREVDAKSFLGMSGISQYPILVELLSDKESDMELFEKICRKYEVKKR